MRTGSEKRGDPLASELERRPRLVPDPIWFGAGFIVGAVVLAREERSIPALIAAALLACAGVALVVLSTTGRLGTRQARRSLRRVSHAVVGLLVATAGPVVAFGASAEAEREAAELAVLRSDGVTVRATVTDIVSRSLGRSALVVRVRFDRVNGGVQVADVDLTSAAGIQAGMGDVFDIVYAPADPTVAVPASTLGRDPRAGVGTATVVCGVLVIAGLAVAVWPLRSRHSAFAFIARFVPLSSARSRLEPAGSPTPGHRTGDSGSKGEHTPSRAGGDDGGPTDAGG